jgi:hypothetical protein
MIATRQNTKKLQPVVSEEPGRSEKCSHKKISASVFLLYLCMAAVTFPGCKEKPITEGGPGASTDTTAHVFNAELVKPLTTEMQARDISPMK